MFVNPSFAFSFKDLNESRIYLNGDFTNSINLFVVELKYSFNEENLSEKDLLKFFFQSLK